MTTPVAFFDLDNTLIKPVSLVEYLSFYLKNYTYSKEMELKFEKLKILKAQNVKREVLNRQYYSIFEGLSYTHLLSVGEEWITSYKVGELYHKSVLEALLMHQNQGDKICIVSGSFMPCIRPIQKAWSIDHILCTELNINDDVIQPGIKQQTIGIGKETVMKSFIKKHKLTPSNCASYGDDISDIKMLELVGNPVAICAHQGNLLAYANEKGWPIIHVSS